MFLVVLANLTAISFSTYILAHYMTRAVPMEHPGMFKTMFIVLQVPVWGINNYLITPGIAQLDILILFLSISLSGIFAKKGFRVKGCIYMLAFLAAQILENYLLNLVVFPAARALGIPPEYLVDKRDYGNAIMGGLCVQTTLGFQNYERLEREIRRVFGLLRGKRWVLCTTHFVQSHCTLDELAFAYDLCYKLARE